MQAKDEVPAQFFVSFAVLREVRAVQDDLDDGLWIHRYPVETARVEDGAEERAPGMSQGRAVQQEVHCCLWILQAERAVGALSGACCVTGSERVPLDEEQGFCGGFADVQCARHIVPDRMRLVSAAALEIEELECGLA